MIALSDIECEKCNNKCSKTCFLRNFSNWTSGNNDIDKFIQETQLSTHCNKYDEIFKKVLEWIPYDRFHNIEYIARGGFGKVYRASWLDGYMINWDNKNQNWKRRNQNMFVALKSLDNSKNVTLDIINEVCLIILISYIIIKILTSFISYRSYYITRGK
jgi:serine/threonine protein kinase